MLFKERKSTFIHSIDKYNSPRLKYLVTPAKMVFLAIDISVMSPTNPTDRHTLVSATELRDRYAIYT